jgi:transposase-like protein
MEKKHRARRRFSSKQINDILNRYRRSGQSKREFCSLEGVSYTTFGNWFRRKRAGSAGRPAKGFVQVQFDNDAAREPVAELSMGSGRVLKFYSMPGAELVKTLLS